MTDNNFRIVGAEAADAPLIGRAVVAALGPELPKNLAGSRAVADVVDLFAALAARTDSQYSYLNTLKAIDSENRPMGFIVGYDGSRLHTLRLAFFDEAASRLGRDMRGNMGDETGPGEFYLDSLAVMPEFRGRGIGSALIEAMARRGAACGLCPGLLCDKSNSSARRLYESLGFRPVGERSFAGELMDHLQRPL